MNIRIEHQAKRVPGLQWWEIVFPIFHHRFGGLSLVLFFILLATETIDRHLLHEGGPLAIGGVGTLIGLGLLVGAIFISSISSVRYRKRSLAFADHRWSLTLTDDYFEREVPGLWQEQHRWPLLTEFREYGSAFDLSFGETGIWIRKIDLRNSTAIAELRVFLQARAAKEPKAAATVPPR
jgi:hypothetical protein